MTSSRWGIVCKSLLNCVKLMLYDVKCYSFNLPLSYLLYLFRLPCQTRGGSNFRESRGLSSSTVDLYTGNWAAGGAGGFLSADLFSDPKMLLPLARSLSHNDHQQHYQTASASHTLSLRLSASDPKTRFLPTFRPKDTFSHQNVHNLRVCFFQFAFKVKLLLFGLPETDCCISPSSCSKYWFRLSAS